MQFQNIQQVVAALQDAVDRYLKINANLSTVVQGTAAYNTLYMEAQKLDNYIGELKRVMTVQGYDAETTLRNIIAQLQAKTVPMSNMGGMMNMGGVPNMGGMTGMVNAGVMANMSPGMGNMGGMVNGMIPIGNAANANNPTRSVGFGTAMSNMGNVGSTVNNMTPTTQVATRFNTPSTTPNTGVDMKNFFGAATMPATTVTTQPKVEQVVIMSPMEGNEYPLLLAPGLFAAEEVKGTYTDNNGALVKTFKYIINGSDNLKADVPSEAMNISVVGDVKTAVDFTWVFFKSYPSSVIITRPEVKKLIEQKHVLAPDYLIDKLAEFNKLETVKYNHVIKLLLQLDGSHLQAYLDKLLTEYLNNYATLVQNKKGFAMESFLEDAPMMMEEDIPKIADVSVRNVLLDIIDKTVQYMRDITTAIDVSVGKSDVDTEANYTIITVKQPVNSLAITDSILASVLLNSDINSNMIITRDSFESLYDVISNAFSKADTPLSKNKLIKLLVTDNCQNVVKFDVGYNKDRNFTIKKG